MLVEGARGAHLSAVLWSTKCITIGDRATVRSASLADETRAC